MLLCEVYKRIWLTLRNKMNAAGSIKYVADNICVTLQLRLAMRGLLNLIAVILGYMYPAIFAIMWAISPDIVGPYMDVASASMILLSTASYPVVVYFTDSKIQESVDLILGFSQDQIIARRKQRSQIEDWLKPYLCNSNKSHPKENV
jgi:hypothetical protein